ncbi:hypothetical protein RYJ27_11860 [Microbacterium limosum]|uniref:Uncharacterized protein n=1 Tax=Microbacterium limosum TaxID=3079935 RepID=A0AAU0MFQ2_9MICO|nr:hypothetical protein [Microbacterium sp. Y20]WOQ69380.1 hypothetical protein RYJ27_11860 [Microbacterium sp. Y20]
MSEKNPIDPSTDEPGAEGVPQAPSPSGTGDPNIDRPEGGPVQVDDSQD